MAWFGWISAFLVGGYFVVAGTFTMSLLLMRGGLETIGPAIFLAALAGVAWCALFLWLSPVSVSFH